MYCSNDPFANYYYVLQPSKWSLLENCSLEILDVIFLSIYMMAIICTIILIFICIHVQYDEYSKCSVKLNLYLFQKGKNLCKSCLDKNKNNAGFINEYQYSFQFQKQDFLSIRMFNECIKEDDSPSLSKCKEISNVIVHDCSSLQSADFEMVAPYPFHLLCLPSSHYKNMVVIEHEYGLVNQKKCEIKDLNLSDYKIAKKKYICIPNYTAIAILGKLYSKPKPMYYCRGKIYFGKSDFSEKVYPAVEEPARIPTYVC